MNEKILVRSTDREWDLRLTMIAGAVAVLCGMLLDTKRHWEICVLLISTGCVTLAVASFMRWHRRRQRQWVRDTGDGFVLIDREGEQSFDDAEVTSLAIGLKRNFQNGLLVSNTRRLLVWVQNGDGQPLEMVNRIKVDAVDPLGDLIDRWNNRILQEAEEQVRSGQSLLRNGWSFKNRTLTLERKAGPLSIKMDELAAVDTVDDHFCLWRHQDTEACARLPISQRDAYLLGLLVSKDLANQPAPKSPPPIDGLGRVIFERKPGKSSFAVGVFVAVTTFFISMIMTLAAFANGKDMAVLLTVAVVIFSIAIVAIIYSLDVRKRRFRCHQLGVFKKGLFGEQQLRYDEMDAFTYDATRHFHNGVYTGTHFALRFQADRQGKKQTVTYTATLRNADGELDHLRDVVAQIMANRFRELLAAGSDVPWLKSATFKPM